MKSNAHPDSCDCHECWEPKPLPGQTVDDACAAEFRKELAQMPDKHVGMILEMAAAELQKRHPSTIVVDTEITADRAQVKKLVSAFIDGLNKSLEAQAYDFIDVFMAAINFVRFVIEDIERRAPVESLDSKKAFRSMAVATLQKTLMRRLMN